MTKKICKSLFIICLKNALIKLSNKKIQQLPYKLQQTFNQLKNEYKIFCASLNDLPLAIENLPQSLTIDPGFMRLNKEETILAMENKLNRVDFFDLCARYALDESTQRIFSVLNGVECHILLNKNAAAKCRMLELYNAFSLIELNIYYDEVALDCASCGYLEALERSLMKIDVNVAVDESLLPKCVLRAIQNGHYHIANHIFVDNYEKGFYSVFPDGQVPPKFFAALLDQHLLVEGDRIAIALLRYLPKLDIQKLRREIERDIEKKQFSSSTLRRFDAMYNDIVEQRNYPCDID